MPQDFTPISPVLWCAGPTPITFRRLGASARRLDPLDGFCPGDHPVAVGCSERIGQLRRGAARVQRDQCSAAAHHAEGSDKALVGTSVIQQERDMVARFDPERAQSCRNTAAVVGETAPGNIHPIARCRSTRQGDGIRSFPSMAVEQGLDRRRASIAAASTRSSADRAAAVAKTLAVGPARSSISLRPTLSELRPDDPKPQPPHFGRVTHPTFARLSGLWARFSIPLRRAATKLDWRSTSQDRVSIRRSKCLV